MHALPPSSVPLHLDEVCHDRCHEQRLALIYSGQGFWFGNFSIGPQTFTASLRFGQIHELKADSARGALVL